MNDDKNTNQSDAATDPIICSERLAPESPREYTIKISAAHSSALRSAIADAVIEIYRMEHVPGVDQHRVYREVFYDETRRVFGYTLECKIDYPQ